MGKRGSFHSSVAGVFAFAVVVSLLQGCGGVAVRPEGSEARREVVMVAISQVGTPYRWGGASPNQGFDCSGLVRYAHQAAGVEVPRAANEQLSAASQVGRTRVQPGDLVFFKVGPDDYHVGILVEPDRFVHAPRGGKDVRLSALTSPYWSSRFIGAGTFLN